MRRGVRDGKPVELEALANRLEAYRRSRGRQGRLPEGLWTQAANLARRYGLYRVQRALHLNYYGLKQRVEVMPAALPSADPAEPGRLRPAFVELGVPPSVLGGAATLEVEDRTGRKLTVRLAREDRRELLALARAVWGCAP